MKQVAAMRYSVRGNLDYMLNIKPATAFYNENIVPA